MAAVWRQAYLSASSLADLSIPRAARWNQVPDGHEKSLKLREVVGEEATDTKVEGLSERYSGYDGVRSATSLGCNMCLCSPRLVHSMDDVAALIEAEVLLCLVAECGQECGRTLPESLLQEDRYM